MRYQIAKGVFDILPKDPHPEGQWRESHIWQFVENVAREIATEYGFQEIRTPLFEATELFTRSVGADSDIVSKEMYTFQDKANRSLSLRPEGTAPIIRSLVENNLDQISPIHKFFYLAPMFRYERQQAGRYRQHNQFGVEAIGSHSPYQDIEVVHLLWNFYERLGLKDLVLQLNSIGDRQARTLFRDALKKFLHPHLDELSSDSQKRYETNPIRILDSKDSNDQKILEGAPKILDFISEESRKHFNFVCEFIDVTGIPYQINDHLVRGLDYYNSTVFEITSGALGAQNSLGGGGRYDGLVEELGGADLPAIGFGTGLERVIRTMIAQKIVPSSSPRADVYLIPLGEEAQRECFKLVSQLRRRHIHAEMDLMGKKLKSAMRVADVAQARWVGVIGDVELQKRQVDLKEMATGSIIPTLFQELEFVLRQTPPS